VLISFLLVPLIALKPDRALLLHTHIAKAAAFHLFPVPKLHDQTNVAVQSNSSALKFNPPLLLSV